MTGDGLPAIVRLSNNPLGGYVGDVVYQRQCGATGGADASHRGTFENLVCRLGLGHPGLHYDPAAIGVFWRTDETVPAVRP